MLCLTLASYVPPIMFVHYVCLFVCVCVCVRFSGTHLGSSKKGDKLRAEPPSLRPPKTNITISGSKKRILSSLCSSHKKTLCVTGICDNINQ